MTTNPTATGAPSAGAVQELRESVRGAVLTRGEPGYDEAAPIWNGMFDGVRPSVIVQCAGSADVIRAVQFARSEHLEIAVRSGGGHSIPGFSTVDGGLVIDLSPMQGIRVDPARRRAVAEPGLTWADFDAETQAFGLASTGGLISTTGVAGFTLGGGIGWLVRRQGLACDHVVSADVVTADGRLVRAGEGGDPELLWGLRGGGGNFGVVTALEFELQPLGPMITGGPVFFAGDRAEEITRFFADWTAGGLPDELTTILNMTTAPPVPFLPEEVHGKPVVAVICAHAGQDAEAEAALAPLKAIADPIADLCGPIPYAVLQGLIDPLWARGARNHMKAGYLTDLGDGAIDALVRGHADKPSPQCELHVHHMGGAAARQPAGGSAFVHRDAPYVVNFIARWTDPALDDDNIGWSRGVYAALDGHLTGGAYVNFLSDEGDDRVREAYGPQTYARLQALKAAHDPENVFHRNQNISPTAA